MADDDPTVTQPIQRGALINTRGRWTGGAELPLLFANQLWAANFGPHFELTFGHNELPYELITPELVTKLEEEGVEIKAISRVAVGPDELEAMIQILAGVLQQWKDRRPNDAR
jgi:hypothetical protein